MGLRVAVEAVVHLILLFLLLAIPSYPQTATQKRTTPNPAQTKKPGIKTEPRDSKFGFRVVSVDNERPPSTMYQVEGLTDGNVRFLLSCHSTPPPLPRLGGTKGSLRERLERWSDQYGSIEKFRQTAIEKVYLASEVSKYVIRLYAPGEEEVADSNGPLDEVVDQCAILKRITNAENIYPIKVISSAFQSWKDGTGYETEAQAADESLTLGCAEERGMGCVSLAPKTYRGTRSGSEIRLYDAELNLVGVYRILREGKLQ